MNPVQLADTDQIFKTTASVFFSDAHHSNCDLCHQFFNHMRSVSVSIILREFAQETQ